MLKKLASGYSKMHELKYAHLDIKPDNVLLEFGSMTGMLEMAITDFGISRLVDESVKQVAAFELSNIKGLSARYASPESFLYFRGLTLTKNLSWMLKSDVYAFAVSMCDMLNRVRAKL